MEFQTLNLGGWVFYHDTARLNELETKHCGKWMYFFDSSDKGKQFAKACCAEIVQTGAAIAAKHTDEQVVDLMGSGVCCFYCNGDDVEAHKCIISFLLKMGMIRKTKTGKLYNISFKYDSQTQSNKYGAEFDSNIKLNSFLNLETGEWLKTIQLNRNA